MEKGLQPGAEPRGKTVALVIDTRLVFVVPAASGLGVAGVFVGEVRAIDRHAAVRVCAICLTIAVVIDAIVA